MTDCYVVKCKEEAEIKVLDKWLCWNHWVAACHKTKLKFKRKDRQLDLREISKLRWQN